MLACGAEVVAHVGMSNIMTRVKILKLQANEKIIKLSLDLLNEVNDESSENILKIKIINYPYTIHIIMHIKITQVRWYTLKNLNFKLAIQTSIYKNHSLIIYTEPQLIHIFCNSLYSAFSIYHTKIVLEHIQDTVELFYHHRCWDSERVFHNNVINNNVNPIQFIKNIVNSKNMILVEKTTNGGITMKIEILLQRMRLTFINQTRDTNQKGWSWKILV